ncbi:MAG: hypothetical protein PHP65_02265 [Bacilli bacterium]|nr:hypothetical protein [Bacilli bacterium]
MVLDLLGAILGIGLLFVIVNRAIIFVKNKIRAIVNLLLGFGLGALFLLAFLRDYDGGSLKLYLGHLFYLSSSVLYGSIFAWVIFFYRFGYSKVKTTSKVYFTEYLYLLYRNEKQVLLFPKGKKQAQGKTIKLKKTDFHDEIIHHLEEKYHLVTHLVNQGKVILQDKKQIYYCSLYYVESANDVFVAYDNHNPDAWPVSEFEKELMLRLNLLEPFTIEK